MLAEFARTCAARAATQPHEAATWTAAWLRATARLVHRAQLEGSPDPLGLAYDAFAASPAAAILADATTAAMNAGLLPMAEQLALGRSPSDGAHADPLAPSAEHAVARTWALPVCVPATRAGAPGPGLPLYRSLVLDAQPTELDAMPRPIDGGTDMYTLYRPLAARALDLLRTLPSPDTDPDGFARAAAALARVVGPAPLAIDPRPELAQTPTPADGPDLTALDITRPDAAAHAGLRLVSLADLADAATLIAIALRASDATLASADVLAAISIRPATLAHPAGGVAPVADLGPAGVAWWIVGAPAAAAVGGETPVAPITRATLLGSEQATWEPATPHSFAERFEPTPVPSINDAADTPPLQSAGSSPSSHPMPGTVAVMTLRLATARGSTGDDALDTWTAATGRTSCFAELIACLRQEKIGAALMRAALPSTVGVTRAGLRTTIDAPLAAVPDLLGRAIQAWTDSYGRRPPGELVAGVGASDVPGDAHVADLRAGSERHAMQADALADAALAAQSTDTAGAADTWQTGVSVSRGGIGFLPRHAADTAAVIMVEELPEARRLINHLLVLWGGRIEEPGQDDTSGWIRRAGRSHALVPTLLAAALARARPDLAANGTRRPRALPVGWSAWLTYVLAVHTRSHRRFSRKKGAVATPGDELLKRLTGRVGGSEDARRPATNTAAATPSPSDAVQPPDRSPPPDRLRLLWLATRWAEACLPEPRALSA